MKFVVLLISAQVDICTFPIRIIENTWLLYRLFYKTFTMILQYQILLHNFITVTKE